MTIEREIRVWNLRLIQERMMLATYLHHQPKGRHFRGEPECPDVIRYADAVEIIEARIRELERRKRVHDDAQRVARNPSPHKSLSHAGVERTLIVPERPSAKDATT